MAWNDAFAELNTSVVDYFGETISYLSLDGLTAVVGFSATLNRGGEDGSATFNMPKTAVETPAFGDKVTDSDGVEWRIAEVLQPFSDRTPCNLKRSDFWETLDLQYMTDDGEVWENHTTGITGLLMVSSSSEVVAAGDGHSVTVYEVKTTHLITPDHDMRFKWGSKYLYITGIKDDDTHELTTTFDCVEMEA